LEERRFFLSV
jgi:hypothetical protein